MIHIPWSAPFVTIQAAILLVILVLAPIYALFGKGAPKKGLNLPAGSVRAKLALIIVSSFVNVLLFGSTYLGENFEQVITALGTLTGAVSGFYFAGRNVSENSNLSPTEIRRESDDNTTK